MGDQAGMSSRAAMFGVVIAAAMASNTPAGAAYDIDTNGDGTPDAIEIVEEKSNSFAKDLSSLCGGNWRIQIDLEHRFVAFSQDIVLT